jgi:hypothetical protein
MVRPLVMGRWHRVCAEGSVVHDHEMVPDWMVGSRSD